MAKKSLNVDSKYDATVNFAKYLKPKQNTVFSDCGNLISTDKIDNVSQSYYGSKPCGLWYGRGGNWIRHLTYGSWRHLDRHDRWDRWERTKIETYTHVYELDLDLKKMYVIRTLEDFKKFTRRYHSPANIAKPKTRHIDWNRLLDDGYFGIDLKRFSLAVAEQYPWYSGWDVGGGCIFGREAVKSVKLLKQWTPLWKETV